MSQAKSVLYLHWGPGANASVERVYFKNSLDILWWDQPQSVKATAFEDLIEATALKIKELSQTSLSGKVAIIAHSFGGQIALRVCSQHPELISRITLLGCSHDPFYAFVNLGESLATLQPEWAHKLRPLCNQAKAERSFISFSELISTIAEIPNFIDHYWSPRSTVAKANYQQALTPESALNLDSFFAIMKGYLVTPPVLTPSRFTGELRLIMGANDPLLRPEIETQAWQKYFPQLQTQIVPDCGHFVTFEANQAFWQL